MICRASLPSKRTLPSQNMNHAKPVRIANIKLPLPLPGHQVKGPTDASNFDCYSRDLETPPDELSGWDDDF